MQKVKVKGHSVQRLEWTQMDGWTGQTDGWTQKQMDGGDCITFCANVVSNQYQYHNIIITIIIVNTYLSKSYTDAYVFWLHP